MLEKSKVQAKAQHCHAAGSSEASGSVYPGHADRGANSALTRPSPQTLPYACFRGTAQRLWSDCLRLPSGLTMNFRAQTTSLEFLLDAGVKQKIASGPATTRHYIAMSARLSRHIAPSIFQGVVWRLLLSETGILHGF